MLVDATVGGSALAGSIVGVFSTAVVGDEAGADVSPAVSVGTKLVGWPGVLLGIGVGESGAVSPLVGDAITWLLLAPPPGPLEWFAAVAKGVAVEVGSGATCAVT